MDKPLADHFGGNGQKRLQNRIQLQERRQPLQNAGHDHFYLTADLSHKVLPFLKVGLSSRAYYIVKNDKPDMFNQFLHMSPLTQTRNEDGSYNVYPFGDPFVKNPYMNESDDVYKDKTEEWKLFLRFFAQIDLAKGLTFNTNFAYSPAFSSRGYYYDNRSVSYTDERNVAFMHNNRKADWVWNNVLNYKRQFGRHNIDLTAVYEMQNRQTVNASMSGKDQESPAYLWYNMGRLTDSKSLSSGFVRSQMVSVVGRVQYSYDDRYIITASFREDGASQLSPGHKWAFFPSGAIAWRISEEPFLKDVEWISNLKLRASYGMTGNYSIAAYATAGTLHGKYANFNGGELHRPGWSPKPARRPTWSGSATRCSTSASTSGSSRDVSTARSTITIRRATTCSTSRCCPILRASIGRGRTSATPATAAGR